MKKLFFTIYFSFAFFFCIPSHADIQSIVGVADPSSLIKKRVSPNAEPDGMPDPNNQEEVREFFKKRFEEATTTRMTDDIDWHNASSINVIHTPEYYKAKEEAEKPLFQKMYEKALAAINSDSAKPDDDNYDPQLNQLEQQAAQTATRFFQMVKPEEAKDTTPKVATVSLSLPSGRRILAPAREHIPYFLSYIDIQANGYIKVEDTITIVANDNKFAYGLERVFPKYAARNQKIELLLKEVTVNKTKIPYITEEIGNNLIIKPKYNQKLEPGVYTYKFEYIVNNKLLRRNDKILMDWNLTGVPLNAFITSANAIVSIPQGHTFDGVQTLIGRGDKLTDRRTNIFQLAGNVIAFSNTTPLFNNESMTILVGVDKNVFIKDFDKTFANFMADWGNILYALAGFLTILLSFILSLISLKKEQKSGKYVPSFNGSLMRNILIGKYDRIAFVAQILEFYRKKALDIVQEGNRLFLERQKIDNSKLNKIERKALKRLFAKRITRLEVNNINNRQLKSAHNILSKDALRQIKKYRLAHNLGYIIFSCVMMLATELFIAIISVNAAQSAIILFSTTLLYAFYVWILRHRFKKIYTAVPIKIFSLLALFIIWMFSSVYCGAITSALIMAMVVTIFAFTDIFGERNNYINDAKDAITKYKEYIQGNAESINLSRDFINQQSNIFALDIVEYFPQNQVNKDYYRLDIADALKKSLIGII